MIRTTAFAFAAAVGLLAGSGVAEDRRATALVHVYVAGPPEAVLRTRVTVRELLARIQVDAVVQPASDEAVLAGSAPDGAARAFLDFRSLAAPRVVLSQGAQGHDLVRRALPASSSLEVSVEEAAHIVYAAIEAASESRERPVPVGDTSEPGTAQATPASAAPGATPPPANATGAGPEPPAESQPTAAAPKPDRAVPARDAATPRPATTEEDHAPAAAAHARDSVPAFDASVSAFGGVSSFASDAVLPGVGGALDVGLGAAKLRPGAMLSAGVFFPGNVSRGGESGSIRAESVRLLALLEWTPWPRVGVAVGAGGGADHVTFAPGATTTVAVSGGVASRYDPVLQGLGELRFRFSGAFGAFALAAADLDLTPHRYVTDTGGVKTPFFALPQVRPTVLVGVTYAFHEAHAKGSR